MKRLLAKTLLNLLVQPLAYASWLCVRHLGAFSRAHDDAVMVDLFGPDDCESKSRPWLARNVRRVIVAAR